MPRSGQACQARGPTGEQQHNPLIGPVTSAPCPADQSASVATNRYPANLRRAWNMRPEDHTRSAATTATSVGHQHLTSQGDRDVLRVDRVVDGALPVGDGGQALPDTDPVLDLTEKDVLYGVAVSTCRCRGEDAERFARMAAEHFGRFGRRGTLEVVLDEP